MKWKLYPASKFIEFKDVWDAINISGPNSPVLNSSFAINSIEAFSTGNEHLAILEEDNRPVSIGIFNKSKFGVWDTFQPSQAPLGLWINNSDSPLNHILRMLARSLPGLVLKIGITQQDPDIYPRPIMTKRINTLDYIDTARVTTTECFEDYWSSRSKNLRHNLKRQRNRLAKEDIVTSLKIITKQQDVANAINNYGLLESAGWKSESGTAVHPENKQGVFYSTLLQDFCERNKGFICQYFYNENLVATDLCIEQNGTFVILKTTYDEKIKTSSPTFLMRQEMFELLFQSNQINRIEFYGKVMDWHTKWSNEVRKLYHLNFRLF
ncbi:MAG: GNAT family N-acetyltransferase [Sedimenticola sp.]